MGCRTVTSLSSIYDQFGLAFPMACGEKEEPEYLSFILTDNELTLSKAPLGGTSTSAIIALKDGGNNSLPHVEERRQGSPQKGSRPLVVSQKLHLHSTVQDRGCYAHPTPYPRSRQRHALAPYFLMKKAEPAPARGKNWPGNPTLVKLTKARWEAQNC